MNDSAFQTKCIETQKILTPGLYDSDFVRGEVPMTKQEIREISICKLKLTENSVVYDIGSGTGSISVEIARLSPKIQVFAIESNEEAVNLTKINAQKFNCENLTVVNTLAPNNLESLKMPTHAFIGGTRGMLSEILFVLHQKNPNMRIVINAVTLESICEIQNCLKNYSVINDDVTQISIAKSKKIGNYNMMMANNPVFVFSFTFNG